MTEQRNGDGLWPGSFLALVIVWVPTAWLIFLWTHEAGHVLGAWLTGGKVQQVVLHPLAFSRTDVLPNPSPMIVAWAGAVLGPVVAVVCLWGIRCIPKHGMRLYWSLLGFILLANGSYIGLGVVQPVGDAADLLKLGAENWMLGAYGVVACGFGFVLWGGIHPFRFFSLFGKWADWLAICALAGITCILAVVGMLCCPG